MLGLIIVPLKVMCLFPPVASLNIFSLSLIYYCFTLMWEGMDFLVFILLELTPF